MAGALPDLHVVEDGRSHLLVAALPVQLTPQRGQLVPDHHPARMPERRARRHVREVEQVELTAQPAVVAEACLLDPFQVLVQRRLVEEGGSVDAGQHRVVGVPAPVGAGRGQQLEGLDRLRRLQVRAAAQVLEPILGVEADLTVRQVAGQLQLVRLRLRLEAGQDLGLVHAVGAHERVLLGEDPAHLLLDPAQVVRRDRLGELEVVVEAVGDRGADRHLGVGPQVQHRLGHHVRRRVAQHRQRLRIASRQDAHAVAVAPAAAAGHAPRLRRPRRRRPGPAAGRSRWPHPGRLRRSPAPDRSRRAVQCAWQRAYRPALLG